MCFAKEANTPLHNNIKARQHSGLAVKVNGGAFLNATILIEVSNESYVPTVRDLCTSCNTCDRFS